MAINQQGNGGGGNQSGDDNFISLPPSERVKRLHQVLVEDELFGQVIPNDFNAFVEEYSQPERMQRLHSVLSEDTLFSQVIPNRYEDAVEWMGFTTKPESVGKPSPTTRMQSGRGGVDSGVGSQSGLQSSSQRRITVDDIGVVGVGGTEPEFNYEVDRQDAEAQSESLRQQRINQGVNQINILVNAAGKEGRGLIEKGLSEGLSQREYQKLYDVLEGTQFRDYISQVNPMTDFVSPNAFRQIFADGITAGGSGAGFSTVTKRGDFDKLSEQANADAVNQWLSGFDSRMQDKVGERAYRAATEQARATYGEKAESVINNAERLIAHQSISEEERNAAALVRELNDLVSSGRELSNEEISRAAELDRQIKSAEVELGKMGTLYDPITGQFIPQMRAPEFAAEVSQREEELSEVKDLDLLKDMRRRAYFAYNEYRKKAGDKDFLYEWIPGQDVDVDRMRAAWKEFSALNRVIELNIDPATISREGENLSALRTGFIGSPNLESNRSVVEGVVDAFRRSGLTPTKEQEDRLQKSFGEQIAESVGASTNIMLKMAAEMAITRGMRGALGLNSYANAFRRVLSATRLGAKAPKAVNISSKILGGVFDVGQSAGIYSIAGAGAATGAGEEIAQKIIDLFTKGKAGRIAKLISGSIGEVTAEYIGEYANALAELGIDNLDEAFRETFGRDPESAMDKLLLTLATIAPFAGVSAIGREFTDSVEKYAKSQPASDVQREVLSVIDVLKEADAKRKGGATPEVGTAATATAAPETEVVTTDAATPTEVVAETAPEPVKSPVTVSFAVDESTQVERNGVTGTLTLDGQTIIFEHSDGKTIEDIGNVDEVSASSISDFGFNEVQRIDLEVNPETMSVVIDGVEYVNNYSKPDAAINTDANGDVVSVTLETKDGKKRTFRGERAQEIAYQYKLIEFEKNATEEQIQSALERVRQIAETTSGDVQDIGQGQAVDTQGTQPEGVAAPVASVTPTAPEAPPAPTANPALVDVESTAKALEGVEFNADFNLPLEQMQSAVQVSEAYHKAKADGSNPKLVESVENLLNQETDATKEQGSAPVLVGDRPQVSEEVRGQDTQGGEVTGEGEVKTKEGEPTQEEVDTIASKAGVKAKNLRDLYRVNRDLFGQNRIKAFASAIVMDRIIGVMAARAGVTKAEMYGKLEFRKASEANLPQGVKMQVNAWHGSPYQFDKFTTEKIGTGEGAQAFGWGLYFTDVDSIAKMYAERLGGTDLLVDGKVVKRSDGFEVFTAANGVATYGYERALERNIELLNDGYLESTTLNKVIDEIKKLKGKSVEFKKKGVTYKVSLHKGKTPDQYTWLEWDKPVSDKIKDLVKSYVLENSNKDRATQLVFKSSGFDFDYSSDGKKITKVYLPSNINGMDLYNLFVRTNFNKQSINNTHKQASLDLLELGINGIKYPAESIARGATSETARGFNYVVFDENAVSIEEVIKFQKDALKARGAMMISMDGQAVIYAITDPNVSTPLHELAHVFEHYLTDAEKAAVQSWAKTKGWTTETSEAFARGFEKYLADGIAPTAQLQKIFDKFKQWLVDIYNGIVGSEIDIELNDSMRDIYARMVGDTDVSVETEPVQEDKVAKIVEGLRSDPNVTEVHVSGNDIVYSKKDKNGNPRYYEKIGGGRSNQLSKTDFEFKREIAMDNATSITEAGIPLEGEPAFLEGEDQTSLNVLDSAPVVKSDGTLPESTERILEQEDSESESLTDAEVESIFEEGGIPLTAITTMSPEQKKSAKQRADERYEASKKKLKESWKNFSDKARSVGIAPTPQSQKAQFDAMLQVFADVAILARDWALKKALDGADLSKLTYFDFRRENRDIFSDSAARVKVGSRFFDKGEDSYASLAFDQGMAMALDPTHQMQTPKEKTGSEALDKILRKGERDSKTAFNFSAFSAKALDAFASAFDYNAPLKNSIIDLANRIRKAGIKSFSTREFFERLQFAAQPGSKIQLKYMQFKRAVYGGMSKDNKGLFDAIILFRSVISLETAINERRAKIAEFENDLKANHGFTDKDVLALNKYAAGTKITDEQKAKIEAYLKSTNQTKSEFKSKIRSIEGKREANKGIGGEYQHPNGLTLDSAKDLLGVIESEYGKDVFDDLQKRADIYFEYNRSLLLDRLNAGQISQYLYDEIANREYVPRIWEDSELISEFSNNPAYGGYDFGVDSNKGGYIGIKRLKGGSSKTEEAVIDSDILMKINTAMAVSAIENHRLMQFVINELVPSSDAYVNFLINQAIEKNGGKPISASEERKIRRRSQIVYELKRTGTAKDGKPKFEPPLDGFSEFVFSDGNTTRAFAAIKAPGGGNFLSNMRMGKKGLTGTAKTILNVTRYVFFVPLIKLTAVAINPSFAVAQLVSMDVMHQMMVTPGVKFVPRAFIERVLLGTGKVSQKAFGRAVFKTRVLFSKLFSKQRPTPQLTAFEKQLEDAIAHGLDFSGGILGEKKYSFNDKSKFGNNVKKFLNFLEEGIRDTELASRLTSYQLLVKRKMKAKQREVKRDLTDEEISEIKRSAAYDVSNVLNYYNRGAVSEAADAVIPFFSAAVNAMKAHARFLPGKLGRVGGGEPMTAKQKAEYIANVSQFIGGTVMLYLWMFAKDEEDERNGVIPAGANGHKDALIIPLWVTEDDNGKRARAFISLPLDKMMGGYNLIGKRIAQDLYYGNEDTWTRGNRPQYPVKTADILKKLFYETIPGIGSSPPSLSAADAIYKNYDSYRMKPIYRSQGGTPDPENMVDERTRAIFRVLARYVNLPAKQLETAVGKVISLNNPLTNLLTTSFAMLMPEDMRGEGETLENAAKAGFGRLYGVSRRVALEEGETEVSIAVGNIGADMASDQVDMVFDELSRVPSDKLAANAQVFADAISNKASRLRGENRGFSTSAQVSRLKKVKEVDYELGEEILDAYRSDVPDVVNDLMSLPDSYFGESNPFYRSLVGDNNGNAAEVGRIIYARRREQSKDMPTIDSLARGFRERLKGMGIDGADGQALAEALAKLSVESDRRNAMKK